MWSHTKLEMSVVDGNVCHLSLSLSKHLLLGCTVLQVQLQFFISIWAMLLVLESEYCEVVNLIEKKSLFVLLFLCALELRPFELSSQKPPMDYNAN